MLAGCRSDKMLSEPGYCRNVVTGLFVGRLCKFLKSLYEGTRLEGSIEERVVEIARYIVEHKATVREMDKAFGISKSTALKTKAIFMLMRMMQKANFGSGEADRAYWEKNGWLDKERPWR